MRTITKKELVNRIADKTTVTKVVAKDIIQSFLDRHSNGEIYESLAITNAEHTPPTPGSGDRMWVLGQESRPKFPSTQRIELGL